MRLNLFSFVAIAIALSPTLFAQDSRSYSEIAAGYTMSTPTLHPKTPAPALPLKEAKKEISKYGVIRYDIYRDRNPYPVDPRKPCHICIQRESIHPRLKQHYDRIYGFQGRPYREREPGGCLCGKKKQKFKHLNANVYWPTFLAGVKEEFAPVKASIVAANFGRFRLVDIYDHWGGFEVSGYQRKDNGYCGPGRDRYGCLGESRTILSNVRGVGFREPGQPVERGGISYP